jgi:hypothetical protein
MKPVLWMVAVSLISWLGATLLLGAASGRELLFGMLGPLVAASGTWLQVVRTYRREPTAVTSFMAVAFALKLVLFGVYVAGVILVGAVRPVPFVVSFTSYFIGLYVTEAVLLHRLFSSGTRASR